MSQANKCPECGTDLPASAPRGLCPACLLKRGLETNTLGYSADPATSSRWTPPTVDELSRRFPELELTRLVGRGGMGAVYQARQKNLDRIVALKILPPEIGHDPAFAERFTREAQAMARLNHPHIVTIHEFGHMGARTSPSAAATAEKAAEDGRAPELYYFIMEYVDGVNLRGLLDSGHISPKEALAIVPQICEALQYAHDQGIVHRDIKPENILLSKQGQVKIADFGLAKLMGQSPIPDLQSEISSPQSQVSKSILGTPQYMAPEQLDRPAEVDHRADIYSLGVVFYQMLTGELPLGRFAPPSRRVQIDVRLDDVVLRALEKQPEKRYQHVSEVKTEVDTITGSAPETAPREHAVNIDAKLQFGEGPSARQWGVKKSIPIGERFSRTAIVGAVWAVFSLLQAIWQVIDPQISINAYNYPAMMLMTLFALGIGLPACTAPVGTTILGCVSLSQIRRSGGRLYGLPLALFDALLFPLLALDTILCLPLWLRRAETMDSHHVMWLIGIPLLCLFLDAFLIRLAWRTASKPLGGVAPVAPAAPPKSNSAGLVFTLGLHLAAMVGVLAFYTVVVPHYAAIFKDFGVALPPITLLTLRASDLLIHWWFLAMPAALMLLAADAAICWLVGRAGWRPLRWIWSMLVLLGLAAVVGLGVWGLDVTTRSFMYQITGPSPRSEAGGSGPLGDPLLKELNWSALASEGRLLGGVPVTVDGRDALKIENTRNTPLRLTLLKIERPAVTSMRYAVTGDIKHQNAQGNGYLELLNYFPPLRPGLPEAQYFTRTMGPAGSGPLGNISGTCDWRPFSLPFDRTGTSEVPTRLELNIFLPAQGVVFLGPIKLLQFKDSAEAATTGPAADIPTRTLHFVQIVFAFDRMTFEGEPVTWEQLSDRLKAIPNRPNTVLCFAVDPRWMPELLAEDEKEMESRVDQLAKRFGFAYASYVGEHPLGEKGGPPTTVPASDKAPTRVEASTFGPVVEREVSEAIDLDSGKTANIPDSAKDMPAFRAWAEETGIDALTNHAAGDTPISFLGVAMRTEEMRSDAWETATPDQVAGTLASTIPIATQPLKLRAGSPRTYAFATREGGMGMLQVIGFTDRGVQIRYKLVPAAMAELSGLVAARDNLVRETQELRARLGTEHPTVLSAERRIQAYDHLIAEAIRPPMPDLTTPTTQPAATQPVQSSPAPSADLSRLVRFELGASQFEDGDRITITEVRGPSETMDVAGIYQVSGTCTLASRDQAMLAAFVTAENSTARPSLPSQTRIIHKGVTTFTLLFFMPLDGWPHVSLYPAGGGGSFGELYFGCGPVHLKKDPHAPATQPTSEVPSQTGVPGLTATQAATASPRRITIDTHDNNVRITTGGQTFEARSVEFSMPAKPSATRPTSASDKPPDTR